MPTSRSTPSGLIAPPSSRSSASAQLRLVRVGGQRARAGVRVHHEEVDRVRAHVEDTESHGRNATASDVATATLGHVPKDESGEAPEAGQPVQPGQTAQAQPHRQQRRSRRRRPRATGTEAPEPVDPRTEETGLDFAARLGRVPRSRRRRAGLPLRSDLADLPLELRLRQRLPGHPGGPRGPTAAARWARTSPTRTTRSGWPGMWRGSRRRSGSSTTWARADGLGPRPTRTANGQTRR